MTDSGPPEIASRDAALKKRECTAALFLRHAPSCSYLGGRTTRVDSGVRAPATQLPNGNTRAGLTVEVDIGLESDSH